MTGLGHTDLPIAAVHGGNLTTASVGSGVLGACCAALKKVGDLAKGETVADFAAVLSKNNLEKITETFESKPGAERSKYSTTAHGA